MEIFLWLGILFCLSQSAIFSGLTLGLFGLSRLQLEIEVESGNRAAVRVLALRKNANLLLTTLLWGNVGINVLLTLFTDSLLTGVGAFFFSTVCITLFGEILPQAYFSRNALRLGITLYPVVRFYQFLQAIRMAARSLVGRRRCRLPQGGRPPNHAPEAHAGP
jgi:CBS domain containing-hemolysin-like protein